MTDINGTDGGGELDVLAFGAHPDDCEIFLGGTLLRLKELSYRVGVCDLSLGEAGTYGSTGTRRRELKKASKCLGLDARITLDLPDGNIRNTEESRIKVIEVIRKYRPRLVFSFVRDPGRHPDHRRCGEIVKECCFLAGLDKIETSSPAFRPSAFVGFPELVYYKKPDFVVDISEVREQKLAAIRCYGSQVTQPGEDDAETRTFIRSHRFWEILEARANLAGAAIGVQYGEPFYTDCPPQVSDPVRAFALLRTKVCL
jgi:bacillithiol biosynthesis deacetylase BshB1